MIDIASGEVEDREPAPTYNFVRIHKTLRTTPAIAAGVTKRLWEMGDIVNVLEAWEKTQETSHIAA
jgi:hypothetical protein